jgi:hypothetical protein
VGRGGEEDQKLSKRQGTRAPFKRKGSKRHGDRELPTGDVTVQRHIKSWKEFFELADGMGIPEDFLSERGDVPPQKLRTRLKPKSHHN